MDDDYVEAVLDLVAAIPPGRVMTYGSLADVLAERAERAGGRARGGPRQVGQVMSRAGSGVPWWRVVNAQGAPPQRHRVRALEHLVAEATPRTADGSRVAVGRAIWFPDD